MLRCADCRAMIFARMEAVRPAPVYRWFCPGCGRYKLEELSDDKDTYIKLPLGGVLSGESGEPVAESVGTMSDQGGQAGPDAVVEDRHGPSKTRPLTWKEYDALKGPWVKKRREKREARKKEKQK